MIRSIVTGLIVAIAGIACSEPHNRPAPAGKFSLVPIAPQTETVGVRMCGHFFVQSDSPATDTAVSVIFRIPSRGSVLPRLVDTTLPAEKLRVVLDGRFGPPVIEVDTSYSVILRINPEEYLRAECLPSITTLKTTDDA